MNISYCKDTSTYYGYESMGGGGGEGHRKGEKLHKKSNITSRLSAWNV